MVADEVSHKLSDMYSQELRLKRTVVEQLAHTATLDLALSYLSMWLHQPYLEGGSRLLGEHAAGNGAPRTVTSPHLGAAQAPGEQTSRWALGGTLGSAPAAPAIRPCA